MRRIFIAFLIFITAGGVLPAQGTDLASVLAKHRTAAGQADSLTALKSMGMSGTITYMGVTGTQYGVFEFPLRYYLSVDLGILSQRKGFDGLVAWTTDHTGITRVDTPEEIKPVYNQLYLASYSYLLPGRNPGRNEYRGDTLIEGDGYHIIALYPDGGDSVVIYIGADNARIEYSREVIGGIPIMTHYTDFRLVSGIGLPFEADMEAVDAPYRISTRIDSVWVNPDIPDSLFRMPGKAAADYRFSDDQDSVVIPFDLVSNSVRVKARVNGKGPYTFLLDSGAGTTTISTRVADDLNLAIEGTIVARGIGGYGEIGYAEVDSIVIGKLSWHLPRMTVFDFASLGKGLTRLDGILGYDLFARFPMMIDFDRSQITLYHPDRAKTPAIGDSIPFDIYLQLPLISATLDGRPVRLAIDLGAQVGVMLLHRSRAYRAMVDDSSFKWDATEITGVGGSHTVKSTVCDSLWVGAQRIDRPVVLASEDFAGVPLPDYIEGLLGVEVLRQFNLVIDYPARVFRFDKRLPANK
jgi:hypothetical protein